MRFKVIFRLFIIIFLSFMYFSIHGQSKTDSLLQAIKVLKYDTNTVNALAGLSNECRSIDNNKSMSYARQGYLLSEKINYKKGKALCLNNIGNVYQSQGNYKKAIENYQNALYLYSELNDRYRFSICLNNIGSSYACLSDFSTALKYFFNSARLSELIKNKKGLGLCYNNLGNVYGSQGDWNKALEYYKKSADIRLELGDKNGLMICLSNIGNMYSYLQKYDVAVKYHLLSLKIATELGNNAVLATCYDNIGTIYSSQGKYQSAIQNYQRSLEIGEKLGDKQVLILAHLNLANVYNLQKRYSDAITHTKEALALAKEIGALDLQQYAYQDLAKYYKQVKDYQEALSNYELFKLLDDSIYNKEKSEQITKLEAVYHSEKKQKEIDLLKKEKEISGLKISQSRYIIGSLIGLIIFSILFAVLLIRQYRLRASNTAMELKQKLLRTQMNPHFIFNTLSAIQSFMYNNKPEDAGRYLSEFARLTRLILENSNYEYVSLDKEIATLNYYMKLQELRFENSFNYTIEIDERIHAEMLSIPPMLAQPFIENAIEHGIKDNTEKGNILIKYKAADEFILFSVEDNGSGLKQNDVKSGIKDDRPHAVSITRERLLNLNHNKKQKIRFEIENILDPSGNIKGARVSFLIPYKYLN
jgi:tetratricopeptide (TPR) repeat protein